MPCPCRSAFLLALVAVLVSAPARSALAQPAAPIPEPSPSPAALRASLYGTVYFNGFSNSGGTNNADVPLFATPTGAGNINASARQTRFGVRLSGVTVAGARLSGTVETDLYGGFPQIGVGETFGQLRLRSAFARLDWDRVSLLAGQDWMVFAPANPVSIACAGIPLMATAGNPWMRLPQLRVERRLGGRRFNGQTQLAVLAPSSGDSTAGFVLMPGSGSLSETPYLQGRLAFSDTAFLGGKKPLTLGVSGHWGRGRVGSGASARDLESYAGAADISVPLGTRLSLLGEAFSGRNLAGFQAAAFQGINPNLGVASGGVLVDRGPRGIATRGGWAQLGVSVLSKERLSFYATFGLDDPKDEDLASVPARDWRARNAAYAASFIHRPIGLLSWGVEVRRTETSMLQSGKQSNTHVNLGVALAF